MKLNRRDFIASSLVFLLGKKLYSETNNFSDLSDDEKRSVLFEIVKELKNKYVFPVPMASDLEKKQALSVNKSLFEFGAGRKGYKEYKHKGIDIYGFDKDIVYFTDGKIVVVGRHKQINKFDFGNIVVVDHGKIIGYDLLSYYLHIGGLDGIKEEDSVKMGETFAKIDCTGIGYEKYNPKKKKKMGVPYPIGSRDCKHVAHLHFQIRVGNMYVNPCYFFPEYSEESLPKLKRFRLAINADSLDGKIMEFRRKENLGSFSSGM